MSDGIYAALSGALGQSTMLESTANNLANASTDGYRRVQPVFQQALSAAGGADSRRTPGVTVARLEIDQSAGALRPTGRALDAALPDDTWLAVSTPRGERYTRAASLQVDPTGAVRNAQGHAVMGENGRPMMLPAGTLDVSLTASGELRTPSAQEPVGRLRLVRFAQPARLVQEGATLVAAGGAQPTLAVNPSLAIGSLEGSNATTVTSMTEMVTATRTFEAFQRVIDAFREADRRVVSSVPGTPG
ncbi:MAG: flagellar hook basal-body protein [Deltaproteobacteria bacterium]|nr:flagellar hook basal-body protein [Myxococcales bacterium]MDP3213963.1 flagellar hook basal-body protein [Deltaproteobacteria bacterium]